MCTLVRMCHLQVDTYVHVYTSIKTQVFQRTFDTAAKANEVNAFFFLPNKSAFSEGVHVHLQLNACVYVYICVDQYTSVQM